MHAEAHYGPCFYFISLIVYLHRIVMYTAEQEIFQYLLTTQSTPFLYVLRMCSKPQIPKGGYTRTPQVAADEKTSCSRSW